MAVPCSQEKAPVAFNIGVLASFDCALLSGESTLQHPVWALLPVLHHSKLNAIGYNSLFHAMPEWLVVKYVAHCDSEKVKEVFSMAFAYLHVCCMFERSI